MASNFQINDLPTSSSNNSQAQGTPASIGTANADLLRELKQLNVNIQNLSGSMRNMSQSNASDTAKNAFRDGYKNSSSWGSDKFDSNKGLKNKNVSPDKLVNQSLNMFSKNLEKEFGDAFKKTKLGKKIFDPIDAFQGQLHTSALNVVQALGDKGLSGAAAAAKTEMAALGPAAASAVGPMAALAAGMVALEFVTNELGKVMEASADFGKSALTSMKREETSAKNARKLAQDRLKADVETMIKTPFQILEDAANRLTQAWDSNIQVINQTQGYTKADLQSLLGNYAERLRSEGLSSYISAADLTTNLGNVLKSGLSGKAAEEFAYQATLLNSAIPSQDFFNFASTYASVAANMIKNGASQDVAIQKANESLTSFANSLLYASRELSGGFTTGLQNASNLYDQAVKISVAARTNNSSQIAGVLTSVAAITGAIAPDLANSLTDTIYQAATGGNSSSIVALRSLAGINASNTEFLTAFAKNPQKVFATLFTNLANMYNSNSGAFMEVAEGYSSLFGLSPEAFQRVDFNYLAKAISDMNTSSNALNQNIQLLTSGESTLTAEQLRNEQINKYMIEEGLAYVLDSEAGRAIQQHMWDEQIAREMQETTYGVDLQGKSIELIESIFQFVKNIANLLNPLAWVKTITQPLRDLTEANALENDIAAVLEATKVGGGNATALRNLVTRNQDLNLVPTLIELLGGTSQYRSAQQYNRNWQTASDLAFGAGILGSVLHSSVADSLYGGINSSISSFGSSGGVSSKYSWGTVGKSAAAVASSLLNSGANRALLSGIHSGSSTSKLAANQLSGKIEQMLADEYLVDQFVKEGKTYEEFAASASKFGISDFSKALEEAGYSETQVRGYFESQETKAGAEELANIRADEKDFRDAGRQFWREDFWDRYSDPMFEEINIIKEEYLQKIIDNQIDWKEYFTEQYVKGWLEERWDKQFWQQFNDYFFEHKIYNGGTLELKTLEKVQKKEKSQKGDLSNALAEMLTVNNQNLDDLKDPAIQTNLLLSQILVVVNAIMNQNAKAEGTVSLAETISALATGNGIKTK